MSERPARSDDVAHALFQLLELGKAAFPRARPDGVAVEPHLEHSTRTWHERDFCELGLKRREQLLRRPAGAEKPPALGAVFDFYSWSTHRDRGRGSLSRNPLQAGRSAALRGRNGVSGKRQLLAPMADFR
jgi:hypothetical protein